MFVVLHPTYTLSVTIRDAHQLMNNQAEIGCGFEGGKVVTLSGHKYFDSQRGKSGCDEALAAVKSALSKAGIEADVSLDRFEHKS